MASDAWIRMCRGLYQVLQGFSKRRRALFVAVPMIMTLIGCDAAVSNRSTVTVADARVTLPAVRGRPGAAYFTLRGGDRPARLVRITADRAERIELHETRTIGGVMRMAALGETQVPAGATIAFGPGGRHAMLFGLDPVLRPGDRVRLTFSFEQAPPVTVQADVRAPGDAAHSGH